MANRKILLCLLFVHCLVSVIECGRFGGRSGGFGRSGGHRSSSSSRWGSGSSSSAHRYPSSSSGLSGSSSHTSHPTYGHVYPSSSSGLSGSGSSSSGSRTNWLGYPSSASGLSGYGSSSSGSRTNSYPSSSSGLSGFGTSSSGSRTNSHSYPSSHTGLSGSGSSSHGSRTNSYPTAPSGHEYGIHSNTNSRGHLYPASTPKSYYPTGNTWSTNQRPSHDTSYHPSRTYHTNTGYGSHTPTFVHPNYYTSPQYVYITEYRGSGSRYGDLLTGLALYNMGRSHSHYHDHYYYDDYYRHRYNSPSSAYKPDYVAKDEALCTLKIKENSNVEVLKIPCAIVSTFTQDSTKVNVSQSQVNTTVCTTKTVIVGNNNTVQENTVALNATASNSTALNSNAVNITMLNTTALNPTAPNSIALDTSTLNMTEQNKTSTNSTLASNGKISLSNSTDDSLTMIPLSPHVSNITSPLEGTINDNIKLKTVNVTVCNTTVTTTNTTDPLKVKGAPVNTAHMECEVNIRTKETYFSKQVDCNTLMQYSKMKEPAKNTGILPPREKLKSWLSKPPWWMSMFIAT